MLRSMYSGVAGLRVHQTRMDVIGNNIANVNTTAYKYQSINFSDILYQNSSNATGATATTGGVNAKQIGLGAIQASISTAIDQQGATQTTNNPFDLRITGDSFFIVNDGGGYSYTRDGSFYVDGEGYFCMQSTGYYVQGWGTYEDENGVLQVDKNGGIGRMQFMTAETMTYPPEATAEGYFSGNIDRNDVDVTASAGKTIQYEFYDEKGYIYTADFVLKDVKTPVTPATDPPTYTTVPNQYTLELTDIKDSSTQISIFSKEDGTTGRFTFDELGVHFGGENNNNIITLFYDPVTGSYRGMNDTGQQGTPNKDRSSSPEDYMNTLLTFTPPAGGGGTDPVLANKLEIVRSMGTASDTAGTRQISFDFSPTTNVNTSSRATIKTYKGNPEGGGVGRFVGTMSGLQVGNDGKVTASYTNGQTRLLGQVAAAQFANSSGLEKQGENLYKSTLNSGEPTVMDITEDGGKMSSGVLEMSNVDLSNEFTSMITAQRGFQANSRIITVSDTLLEELTNLKR